MGWTTAGVGEGRSRIKGPLSPPLLIPSQASPSIRQSLCPSSSLGTMGPALGPSLLLLLTSFPLVLGDPL